MDRTPPVGVRRQLAEEVGFGCPVDVCGSPYLTWHHFDPPWSVEEHHRPDGMVALCRDHHPEADAGAFTVEQLRAFKGVGRDRSQALGARFNWTRERLLSVVGGNFYYETPIPVRIGVVPVVWFNRDASERLLVNIRMPTTSGEPRMMMIDNVWITEGAHEHEIVCPPSGRLVSAKYPNGDRLKIEFRELMSLEDLDRRYPPPGLPADVRARLEGSGMSLPEMPTSHAETVRNFGVEFPITSVEITMDVAGSDLRLGPTQTSIGTNRIIGGWMKDCAVGIQIGDPDP